MCCTSKVEIEMQIYGENTNTMAIPIHALYTAPCDYCTWSLCLSVCVCLLSHFSSATTRKKTAKERRQQVQRFIAIGLIKTGKSTAFKS